MAEPNTTHDACYERIAALENEVLALRDWLAREVLDSLTLARLLETVVSEMGRSVIQLQNQLTQVKQRHDTLTTAQVHDILRVAKQVAQP